MAAMSDARVLHDAISNSPQFIIRIEEARKIFYNPNFDFLYDYSITLLRKRHWSLNEISSDYRILAA